MTIRVDDRTPDELKTHTYLITATDRFLSGRGLARGSTSKCAWACTEEQMRPVLAWVRNRSDMIFARVRYPSDRKWSPRAAHVHIYCVSDDHPALGDLD